MNDMIEGIIFDLDGVITDTAEYHYNAWKFLGNELGIEVTREFNEQLKGVSRMDSLELILSLKGKSQTYSEIEKIELANRKNSHYINLIENITPSNLLPGIYDLLLSLKSKSIKIALASASKNGPTILEKLGITSFFDAIVDPATLTYGKPDPEIFLKAAEYLELPANKVVGVEDAQAGIASINTAGIFSIGVGSLTLLEDANYVVTDTSQLTLENILKAVNTKSFPMH